MCQSVLSEKKRVKSDKESQLSVPFNLFLFLIPNTNTYCQRAPLCIRWVWPDLITTSYECKGTRSMYALCKGCFTSLKLFCFWMNSAYVNHIKFNASIIIVPCHDKRVFYSFLYHYIFPYSSFPSSWTEIHHFLKYCFRQKFILSAFNISVGNTKIFNWNNGNFILSHSLNLKQSKSTDYQWNLTDLNS